MRILLAWLAAFVAPCVAFSAAAQTRAPTAQEQAQLAPLQAALERKDFAEARRLLAQAALADWGPAHRVLGSLHWQGLGGPVDKASAKAEMRKAVQLGDPAASGVLGQYLFADGDQPGAVAAWQQGAQADASSAACLAMARMGGLGTEVDKLRGNAFYLHASPRVMAIELAAGCVRAVAEAGGGWAEYLIARYHLDRTSPGYDPAAAAGHLERAAQLGIRDAAAELGRLYDAGEEVPRDRQKAASAYQLAGQLGDWDSYVAWGRIVAEINPSDAETLAETARYVLTADRRAECDYECIDPDDSYTFARFFQRIAPVLAKADVQWQHILPPEIERMMARATRGAHKAEALAWLRQEADQGSAAAQYDYAEALEFQSGKSDEAFRYLERAANAGWSAAMRDLARTDRLPAARRVALMRAAADNNDGRAMLELADWYSRGEQGLARDPAAGDSLRERAANLGQPDAAFRAAEYYLNAAVLVAKGYDIDLRKDRAALASIQRDSARAARYYELAHNAGSIKAAGQLGGIYSSDIEGVGDPALALKWYLEAAALGGGDKVNAALARIYSEGRGTQVDLVKADFYLGRLVLEDARARREALHKRMTPAERDRAERALIVCDLQPGESCVM